MDKLRDLSQVYGENSAYFYGYPAGWDAESRFLNNAPPASEELVATRPLVCAGSHTNIVVFARTVQDKVLRLLQDELGTVLTERRIVLPEDIDISVQGDLRNTMIQKALQNSLSDKTLVMAQPYINSSLEDKYLIDPRISAWANDKDSMRDFVPEEFQIPELARASSGEDFKALNGTNFPYPCVVKLSASSGGDGVRICKSASDFALAQKTFASYNCTVLVLKFIDTVMEVGAKFAVHPGPSAHFSRIGATKDFSGRDGDWVGSLVGESIEEEVSERMYAVLENFVLPKLRERGWYGVGEAGALIDKDGRFFFSDFNCRFTGDMAQTFQMNQQIFTAPKLMVFNGLRQGTLNEFEKAVKTNARRGDKNQMLNVVSATEYDEGVRLHGGVLFDQDETLMENIARLESVGIRSKLFDRLHEIRS